MAYQYNFYDEEETDALSQQEFDHAKDHLIGLLEDIYDTGKINDLEFHLEEICSVFGLKLPMKDPVISKAQTQVTAQKDESFKELAIGLTRAYASMLCTK